MAGQFFDEQKKALDILRMSDQDHDALVSELDRSAIDSPARDKRRNKRLPYRSTRGLTLEVTHPGGSTMRFVVKPRNISRTGLSVLHGGFIHTHTQCVIPLRSLTGKPALIRGRIVTCRHIRGRVHELGIEFDQAIVLAQFVLDVEARDHEYLGPVSLPTLKGSVLVADEWESDRKLLEYDLLKLGLEVTLAASGTDALQRLQARRFDAVLTGEWLGDITGVDLAGRVRKAGDETPVLGVFTDAAPPQVDAAAAAGIGSVIGRPYKIEHLAQLLLQYLSFDGGGRAGSMDLSTKWVESGMRPMILSFLEGLELRVADLEGQLTNGRADPLSACHRLRSAAVSFGLPRISDAAEELACLLQAEAPLPSVQATIHRLAGLTDAALKAAEQNIIA